VSWAWVWWVLAAGILGNGLRLRRRCTGLGRVDASLVVAGERGDQDERGGGDAPDGARTTTTGAARDAWIWFTGGQVTVPDRIRRRVEQYAEDKGLDVIDVAPRALGVGPAMDLLRFVDPRTYRSRRLAPGATAGQAIAVRQSVDARARLSAQVHGVAAGESGTWPPVESSPLDAFAFHRWAALLKRCAASTSDIVVVDGASEGADVGLGLGRRDPTGRMALLKARYGDAWPLVVAVPAGLYALLAVGVYVSPVSGLAAVACWCLQPLVTFLGTPLSPGDLWYRSVLRWVMDPVDLVRTVFGRSGPPPGEGMTLDPESLRPVYAELLAEGTDRFFEPRRPDCPLCSSMKLQTRIRTPDLLQHKPGVFELVECRECGHVFQNPRLSLEGLEFYYRDFYDGLGQEQLEFVFGASDTAYKGRAAMLDGRHRPQAWLDVGAGHGHFCLVAREHWPDTRFDGLDMSDSIEEAERRGWVSRGFRGLFPELSLELAGAYDVVSMHHYLEHTRDPMMELEAARRVLQPGGYLLIELPDPESVYGRILGKYWVPWFQPQHQHLLSVQNLEAALRTKGMTVEAIERGVASQPVDFLFAVWFLVNRLAPAPDLPWRRPSKWYHRVWRDAVVAVSLPVFVVAFVVDQVLALLIRRRRRSNTYRVLAQVVPFPSGA